MKRDEQRVHRAHTAPCQEPCARSCTGPSLPEGAVDPLPVALGLDQMDDYRQQFRDMRRQCGGREAVEHWSGTLLDGWLSWIACEEGRERPSLDDASWVAHLVVGINEVLSIRDALILTLLTGCGTGEGRAEGQVMTRRMLVDIAAQPHSSEHARVMSDTLNRVFHTPQSPQAQSRCRRGLVLLKAICASVPEECRVQALAMIAYISWWLGEAGARAHALKALELDERCTLAAIVICALEQNIHPNGFRS